MVGRELSVGDDEPGTVSDAGGPVDGAEMPPVAPAERSDSSDETSAGAGEDCDGAEHGGRRVISMEVPVHIDKLFAMLFTNSDFFQAFYQKLKYYDVSTTEWEDGEAGSKTRRNRFLLDVMGKTSTSTVTEDQTMLPISQPGRLYVINAEVKNAGVPMADLFYTTKHYCIHRLSSNRTKLDAWCQTKFRKSTLFKSFIEKTANEGMEEHHSTLEQMLTNWLQNPGEHKRRRRQSTGPADAPAAGVQPDSGTGGAAAGADQAAGVGRGLLLLVLSLTLVLLALDGFLYLRLSQLGRQTELLLHGGLLQAGVRADPELLERLSSVQRQKEQHLAELARWQQAVRSAAQLVRQSEAALNQLHGSMDGLPEGSAGSESPPRGSDVPSDASTAGDVLTAPPTAGQPSDPGPAAVTVAP